MIIECFLEPFPADRFKLFHAISFFQDKKGASAGRSFFSGKRGNSNSKGFPLSSGLETKKDDYLQLRNYLKSVKTEIF